MHACCIAGTKAYWRDDKAKDPLFTWVKDEALRRPTYKSFIALLDNYETSTGKQEEVTPEEIRENWTFINNICDTKVCIKKEPMSDTSAIILLWFILVCFR